MHLLLILAITRKVTNPKYPVDVFSSVVSITEDEKPSYSNQWLNRESTLLSPTDSQRKPEAIDPYPAIFSVIRP
ncbi:MAG: hypothetical protein D6732_21080 [Methanobacteriota archaeon]|nr:MAG: hypothetical protein D6732_21080 [Euryarchaeota archaeon]